MEIAQLSVDQLWDAVCLATKECHICGGAKHQDRTVLRDDDWCGTCEGTGRVWALPGMQEVCTYPSAAIEVFARSSSATADKTHRYCPVCHGTGYVANRSLETLVQQVYPIVHTTQFYERYANAIAQGDVHTTLVVVAEVLVSQSCQLGDASR